MFRIILVVNLVLFCLMAFQSPSKPQASKQLDERAKKVAAPQQNSWKQVDEINKETDKTKSRYQQAQQSGAQAAQKPSYTVRKSKVGGGSAYKKPSHPKLPPKKK